MKRDSSSFTCSELTFEEFSFFYSETSNVHDIQHITQSPNYKTTRNNIIFIGIYREGLLIALTIAQKYKILSNIYCIARINRGPHFLKKIEPSAYNQIFRSLYKFLKSRKIYFLFIAPNTLQGNDHIKLPLISFRLPIEGWSSTILKLSNDSEKQFLELKAKWRNTLRKGLKSIVVEEINEMSKFELILIEYLDYANSQSFKPISSNQLKIWFSTKTKPSTAFPKLRVYRAYNPSNESITLGAVGIGDFLNTSIYLFGFSSLQGKKFHANSVLLWNAIKDSIFLNFSYFDLGGLNSKTPLGIRRFKEGLNGTPYSMNGEYFSILLFN